MKGANNQGLIGRYDLTKKEIIEVRQLAGICNAFEGLDLKLELDGPPIYSAQETNRFLYYEGSKLVGFCSLYYEELCGMVHPEHRRKGIGKILLAAVIKECKSRSISNILIICEEASQSGKGFVNATTSAEYDFAEHHMELEPDANWGDAPTQDSKYSGKVISG